MQHLGPFISDQGGNCFALFTPTQVGTYTLQLTYPGQDFSSSANLTYIPCTSAPTRLVVQQSPVTPPPTPTPAPTPSLTPQPSSSSTRPIANTNSNSLPYVQQEITRLANGTLVATFATNSMGTVNDAVYVVSSNDNGQSWNSPVKVSNASGMDGPQCGNGIYGTVIATDNIGNLYVAWTGINDSSTYFQVWCARYNNITGWSKPVQVSQGAAAGVQAFYTSIAVDDGDRVHLVWDAFVNGYSYSRIFYTAYNGSWMPPIAISTEAYNEANYQAYPQVAVDIHQNLHVVWVAGAGSIFGSRQIWYTKFNGTWQTPIDISSRNPELASRYMDAPAIAMDINGNLHIVWTGASDSYPSYSQIWYTKYSLSTSIWSVPARISTAVGMAASNQKFPSIAVEPTNTVNVAWASERENAIFYTNFNTFWATPIQIQPSNSSYPHLRWSFYPASNIVRTTFDYVFLSGTVLTFGRGLGGVAFSSPSPSPTKTPLPSHTPAPAPINISTPTPTPSPQQTPTPSLTESPNPTPKQTSTAQLTATPEPLTSPAQNPTNVPTSSPQEIVPNPPNQKEPLPVQPSTFIVTALAFASIVVVAILMARLHRKRSR